MPGCRAHRASHRFKSKSEETRAKAKTAAMRLLLKKSFAIELANRAMHRGLGHVQKRTEIGHAERALGGDDGFQDHERLVRRTVKGIPIAQHGSGANETVCPPHL